MAGGTPANPATLVGATASQLFGFGFFYEHHGDVVDYRVEDFALRTAQVIWLLWLYLRVAFGASENFEEFFRDHARMVVRLAP